MDFILNPNLVLYLPLWKLDGSSFMSKDACGHLCTVTGALWRPDGRYFDGTDDDITIGSESFWDTIFDGFHPLSVLFWYKGDQVSDLATVFTKGTAAGAFTGLYQGAWNGAASATDFQFHVRATGATDEIQANIQNVYEKDVWQCWCITLDGTGKIAGMTVDINGVSKVITTKYDTLTTAMNNNDNLKIGGGVIAAWWLSGLLSEFLVYTRALSPIERQNYFLATKWRYR